jgi:hypothetical protein
VRPKDTGGESIADDGRRAHRVAVQELRGGIDQEWSSELRVRQEVWYRPVEFTNRRIVPRRCVQPGDVYGVRVRLIDSATGNLIALLCGCEIFQHERETVTLLVHLGEVAPRDVDAKARRDLAVERRLAPIAELARGATGRIGCRHFHDQPVRTVPG